MRRVWILLTFSLLIALAVGTVASPTAAKKPTSPGTAAYAAAMCNQGGYAEVKGTDGTTFANTGACVSYVAQGGTLVPIDWVAPETKSVTIFQYQSGGCAVGVHVYGFPEGGPYLVQIVDAATGETAHEGVVYVGPDGSGTNEIARVLPGTYYALVSPDGGTTWVQSQTLVVESGPLCPA